MWLSCHEIKTHKSQIINIFHFVLYDLVAKVVDFWIHLFSNKKGSVAISDDNKA